MNKVLVTGITGLVGSAFVVALSRERDDYEFVCLVRKGGGKSAAERVDSIIRDECVFDGCPEIADKVLSRISVVEGDVTSIDPEALAKDPVMQGVNIVFHCAADVNLGKDPTGKV
ncbi:MAG: SDR family oxidoreductase, partial [Lentisphaeria bacterium]|nr:SDR family oxidoreductase [Lentisphaeria bacterium]